jgi:hypothetical protein
MTQQVPVGFVPDGFEPDPPPAVAETAPPPPAPVRPGSRTSLALGTGRAAPALASAAGELATNPNVPKVAAKIGRVVGGIAPIIAGAKEGGPVGAMVGVAASSKGAWAGGKTGWFTGKLAQSVAAPVAKILETTLPYARAISNAAGPQGILDLAQMADPNRTDIGFLGAGKSVDVPGAHPPLLNLAATKVREAIAAIVAQGVPVEGAVDLLLTRIGGANLPKTVRGKQ